MRKFAFSTVLLAGIAAFLFLTSEVLSIEKQTPGPVYKHGEIIVKFKKGAAEILEEQISRGETPRTLKLSTSLDDLSRKYKLKKIKPLIKDFKAGRQRIGELLKKDKASLTKREEHLVRRLKRAPEGAKAPELDRIYKIELEEGQSAEEAVAEYKQNPDVEYAELNYIVHAAISPNDPCYNVQWALNNTGQSYPVSGGGSDSGTVDADINAPEAWDIYTGSSDTIVAVIDSGVDYTHTDLIGNMWTDPNGNFGIDFFNGDSDPMDDFGHGTHCAGIIASRTNNGINTAGVCWNAKIMAVKFLNASGSGPISYGVSAVYYAVDNGADVLSNSWGGTYYSESLEDAINYAYSQGVIIVAGAGNDDSSTPFYPAYYNHVISVAATDSDDHKASFSNYGEWVTLAAPGVDILSLRAQNTDMYLGATGYNPGDRFVPFGDPDATMYIASGTSMACPYVSGACALLLSANPFLTSEEVNDILVGTVGPIADGVCFSDGRLNLFGAITEAIQSKSKGHIALDSDYYSCDSSVGIFVADGDLSGEGICSISITTTNGDSETVILTEESPPIGAFTGTIHTTTGEPSIEDGNLQVTDGDVIYATYYDANDGTGNTATATDTSTIDCVPPIISDVQMNISVSKLIVTFNSNEPTAGEVSCGLACGGPYNLQNQSLRVQTGHAITISALLPYTTYYFIVTATDVAGNQTVDSNSGNCYSFTTTGPGDVYVPSQYPTIQEAMDYSWPGSVVWVANGIYTGQGNRDIDFQGRAITVRSENGPAECIIDCQGNSTEPHRGFYFHSGETQDTIVDGFTITNGYGHLEAPSSASVGGGICCIGASPTITNCIITNNRGSWGGGGIGCYLDSYPHISDCIISGNRADWGGGIACDLSDPEISNCVLTDNQDHGALYCAEASPIVRNCLFYGNNSTEQGGAVRCIGFWGPPGTSGRPSDPDFFNCTFVGNSAGIGGGIYLYRNSHVTATDCIFWGNVASSGHEIYVDGIYPFSSMTVSYCDIQSVSGGVYVDPDCTWNYGPGNIDADPCFVSWPWGDYYLSQTAAGQAVDSPCVDTGSDTAVNLGLNTRTTRTDKYRDIGIADMGYHYPLGARSADIDENWHVDFIDFAILAEDWGNCSEPCDSNLLPGDIFPDWCVDFNDLAVLVYCWLDCYVAGARNPTPSGNAAGVDLNIILNWTPGGGAVSHDVYFGTDYNGVNNATIDSNEYMGNQDTNSWDPNSYDSNGLAWETTYHWRIDSVGSRCKSKGNVWSFTTWSEFDPNFGLVGWWELDEGEGDTAYDSAGNNDGTLVNGLNWTTGQIGGALDFNGISGYVEIPDDDSLTPSGKMTIAFWLYNRAGMDAGIYKYAACPGESASPGNSRSYIVKVKADTLLMSFEIFSSAGVSDYILSDNVVEPNAWHHIAATFDQGDAKIYIDGVPDGSETMSVSSIMNDAQPLIFGGYWSYCNTDHFVQKLNGILDDVRIYDRALSAVEILQLYQMGQE